MSGLFWSLCWAYTGQFFIVLSLAEMAAMAPTAGGQYHWVSEFAPREYQARTPTMLLNGADTI
jgi:choline transport protein